MRRLVVVLAFVSSLLFVGCAGKTSEQNADIGTKAKVLGATQAAEKQEFEAKQTRQRIDQELATEKERNRKAQAGSPTSK